MRRFIVLSLVIASALGPAHADDKKSDMTRTGKVRAEGAIVCPSIALVAFLKEQLSHGFAFPDFKSVRCTLLPEGTPVTIEDRGNRGPILTSETMFGVKVRGVTDLEMIEMDAP